MNHLNEMSAYINNIPQYFRTEYGITNNYDISLNSNETKHIHTDEYDFVRCGTICTLFIDDVPVKWSSDESHINPRNKSHLDEIKRRIKDRRHDSVGLILRGTNGRIICNLLPSASPVVSYSPYFESDNSKIYYNPAAIDINDPYEKQLCEMLFFITRRKEIYLIADKNTKPEEWEG